MTISPEQAIEIKKQLLTQVEKLPQENRDEIKEYIKSLDEMHLEEFLKQNKVQIPSSSQNEKSLQQPSCVFCAIVKNQIPSYKLAETKKAIALLEINPLSKAHSIIIPLEHLSVEKLPKSAMALAQKLTKKIKKKFKPSDIKIETSSFMNHAMINVIPIYKDIQLKKQKADEKELKQIQQKLQTRTRTKRTNKKEITLESKKQKTNSNLPVIKMRIP